MTTDEYGQAYQSGFNLTVRFLVSRGLSYDSAQETAQAAWAKGWERLGQLRDQSMVLTWMNSIALNIHRSYNPARAAPTGVAGALESSQDQSRSHRRSPDPAQLQA